jgi:murein DD-endopeptidase MepM/ murein hydrolase activator NlpD
MKGRTLGATALLLLAITSWHDERAARAEAAPPEPLQHATSALALAALDRKIADLDAEEQAHKKELSGLSGKIANAHARAVYRGKTFYKLTRAGMLPIGGGFDALVTHAMRVERARRTLGAELSSERALRSRGAELASALEHVEKDRSALSSQRTAMDAARLAMEDEARREQAFSKAFETSGDYVAVYGASGAAPGLSEPMGATGFAAARGRLLFPVAGRAESRPGRREGADGPGLEIRAALGTTVRAVYAARVSFADRYGSYGRIVILDHGEHYYTVSGNLATIDVRVGDEIGAGERIGTVGDEGQGALLYFEVRHGSETVPPGPWIGL